MYSNYSNMPVNSYSSSSNNMKYSSSNMPYSRYPASSYSNDDRLIGGGFLGPFILGGITGGLVAPAFTGGYGYGRRPCCYNNYPVPYRPYYGPYYI